MDKSHINDPNVGFLYKTMLARDPRKRQVKPIQRHLMTIGFGALEDSEDDEDFKVQSNEDSDDSDEIATSEDDDISDDEDDEEKSSKLEQEEGSRMTFESKESESGKADEATDSLVDASEDQKPLKLQICGVCLEDVTADEDEMLECDNCGLSVHEGCYGIADDQSEISTESTNSTEPWFCDGCKAGVQPFCELCPNEGGLFKETDAGKWVHLVCALYVPGVAFGNVQRLKSVTLHEMSMMKWGAKVCSLCDDPMLSRTGVCIACDAGMCRTHFHPLCALKEGLLSETSSHDDEVADPFFAHCKLHSDKATVARKRRNHLIAQSNVRAFENDERSVEERARITRKLAQHRAKYEKNRKKHFSFWYPDSKAARLLTSSPSAVKHLMAKAQLLGEQSQQIEDPHTVQSEIHKKWHLQPAFSMEFVAYYMDRSKRIDKLREKKKSLTSQKEHLEQQDARLRKVYSRLQSEVAGLSNIHDSLTNEAKRLWTCLSALSTKKIKQPSFLTTSGGTSVKKAAPAPSVQNNPTSTMFETCSVCKSSTDQHLLVDCDTCRSYYHLGCLDPPLTRMPRKSKIISWQCSQCAPSSSDESTASVDTAAPMRLRENIKLPQKFAMDFDDVVPPKSESKKRKTSPPERLEEFIIDLCEEPEPKRRALSKQKSPESVGKTGIKCHLCKKVGSNVTMAKCGNIKCQQVYHLHCLTPSLSETPTGGDWLCPGCVSSSSSNEDSDLEGAVEHVDEAVCYIID